MTITNSKKTIALYIHWPFCLSKCPYCDFNSHVAKQIDEKAWLEAYLKEIQYFFNYLKDYIIVSIFFGGGTPSLMPDFIVREIINYIKDKFTTTEAIEITLESNPTSVEYKKLQNFYNAGINRISLGVQSINNKNLSFLGRTHSAKESLEAMRAVKSIFSNYSLDMIYALPEQTLLSWEKELKEVLKYADKHISLYQLTIEKGTPFYALNKDKKFILPDSDLSCDLYNLTQNLVQNKAFEAYEISNYSIKGYESLHNLYYWNYNEYLGIGPGAHSRIVEDNVRYAMYMIYNPEKWLSFVMTQGHSIQKKEALSKLECLEEYIIMGMRLKKGINSAKILEIYGKDINFVFKEEIIRILIEKGLINFVNYSLYITEKGKFISSSIINKLIENINN